MRLIHALYPIKFYGLHCSDASSSYPILPHITPIPFPPSPPIRIRQSRHLPLAIQLVQHKQLHIYVVYNPLGLRPEWRPNCCQIPRLVYLDREEAKLHVSHVSRHVYFDDWIHKGVPMDRYTFHTDVCEEIQPQQIWCNEQQVPVGTEEGAIKLNPDEHMDFCWATEAQVRDSLLYDAEKPQQEGFAMLENKKKTILDAFQQLQDSQLDMIVRSGKPRE